MHIFSRNKNYYKNWPVKFWYNEGMDICLSVDSQWASKRKEHRGMEERMCSEKNILQVQKLERITADSQSCRGMKELIYSVKVKLDVWEFFRKSDHLRCLSNDSLPRPNVCCISGKLNMKPQGSICKVEDGKIKLLGKMMQKSEPSNRKLYQIISQKHIRIKKRA